MQRNCNFTARIISLLYIYPQFTYELLHILHVMYLHIWRGQTTWTFHGLHNWKSSHQLQLQKPFFYMVQCNLFPNTLYIGKPNDKWKTVWVPQSSWLPSQHYTHYTLGNQTTNERLFEYRNQVDYPANMPGPSPLQSDKNVILPIMTLLLTNDLPLFQSLVFCLISFLFQKEK